MDSALNQAFLSAIDWDDGENAFNEEFEAKLARLDGQERAIGALLKAKENAAARLIDMHCDEIRLRIDLVNYCKLHCDDLISFYEKQILDYAKLVALERLRIIVPAKRQKRKLPMSVGKGDIPQSRKCDRLQLI